MSQEELEPEVADKGVAWWKVPLVAFVGMVPLAGVYLLLRFHYGPVRSLESEGQLGDTFGPAAAILAVAAVSAAVYSVMLQTKELAAQREAVRLQWEEMKDSREALERSAKAQEDANELQAEANALAAATLTLSDRLAVSQSVATIVHINSSLLGAEVQKARAEAQNLKIHRPIIEEYKDELNTIHDTLRKGLKILGKTPT